MIVASRSPHPQPFMGCVIDNASADHLQEQWVALMMKGGRPIRRLERPKDDRPFLTPALIDVTDAKDVPDEEMFGPVLQIIRVKDFDAAIDEANNTRFGLAASLIGGSPEQYDKFWANVRAGVINWNKPTNGAPSTAPFGGDRHVGQPPPERFLRGRLLRLSGDQQRERQLRGSIGEGLRDPICRKTELFRTARRRSCRRESSMHCLGKAVALALLSVSLSACGNLFSDPSAMRRRLAPERAVTSAPSTRRGNGRLPGTAEPKSSCVEVIDGAGAHGLKPRPVPEGRVAGGPR